MRKQPRRGVAGERRVVAGRPCNLTSDMDLRPQPGRHRPSPCVPGRRHAPMRPRPAGHLPPQPTPQRAPVPNISAKVGKNPLSWHRPQ